MTRKGSAMADRSALPLADGLPTEEMIRGVVHAFYETVRNDELLAPVFSNHIDGHWDQHLATMTDFWSSVLLTTGRYRGRPLAVHGQLGDITPAMWGRWLELFEQAAVEHCPENAASLFVERSRQIAEHLSTSLKRDSPFRYVEGDAQPHEAVTQPVPLVSPRVCVLQ